MTILTTLAFLPSFAFIMCYREKSNKTLGFQVISFFFAINTILPNTSHGSLELASVCFLNNALICLSTVFQLCKHGRMCNMSNRTRDRYFSLYSCLLLYSLFWIPIYWKSAFKILSDDLKIYYCTFKLKMKINRSIQVL